MSIRIFKLDIDDIPGILRGKGIRWNSAYEEAVQSGVRKVYLQVASSDEFPENVDGAIYVYDKHRRLFQLLIRTEIGGRSIVVPINRVRDIISKFEGQPPHA